jgi:primosomal protein N' (replication factor Y)
MEGRLVPARGFDLVPLRFAGVRGRGLGVLLRLPVPLARAYTYLLPLTLRARARAGCRIVVPFGSRQLTGVILKVHNIPPGVETREALRLLDPEPVYDDELLALARWVADYYCAPLGEVLRSMAPLAGDIRR